MKKWQKILGIVIFLIIGLLGVFWQWVTFADTKGWRVTFAAHDCKGALYLSFSGYAVLMWVSYFLALFLFICLWWKGGKK